MVIGIIIGVVAGSVFGFFLSALLSVGKQADHQPTGLSLYVYDRELKIVHKYGTDCHDGLVLDENGGLFYHNLQNGEGSQVIEDGYTPTYSFCDSNGNIPPNGKYDLCGDTYLDISGHPIDWSDEQ